MEEGGGVGQGGGQGDALGAGKRTSMLEAYRKRIEDTRKQLQSTKGGEASEQSIRPGGVDKSKPVTPVAPPLPPTRPKGDGSRRPSFTSPAPPPARSVDVGRASHEDASSSSSVPPISKRSPRSSFRRSSVVRATSPAPRGDTAAPPSPAVPKAVAGGGEGKETATARAETPQAALVPEVSPRTKAKELIGQTLENLRKKAMPFASKPQGASVAPLAASSSGKEKAEEVSGRKEGRQGRTVELLQSAGRTNSSIAAARAQAGAGGRSSGGTDSRVTRLLQDASLIHKKVDALVERDQNIKSSQNQQKRGKGKGAPEVPNTLFVDRLYQSITKLKDLERSRNKMAVCAESMESSVKSLHRFADQIDAEKEREHKQEEEKRQAAESVVRTNGSLLQTEITMLLRSYAVEKSQIDQVKSSIRDFLELCVKQLRD
ncbi:hypothetical protein HOP50_16g77090 [Chloropicon primus]|uniref:Uncharacterized protein n=1 Tax=Chloropicon primus TaxID=1764295 RepID=A0A5B8MX76_9CHLO|nr:hypothetical protein A3770_16p76810 [Chloropicon primus]UPR04368.1 hypothetical protein HOP50_16g77090 [Chloropicon primus]|eukprot:QDZ25163.1 hypothetical protein A3770_16p76810 [Chloropicon primus]